MQCPKCHKNVSENDIICPYCKKVLLLECPNCHSLNETGTCQNCGYSILVKCSKCGKTNSITRNNCKCGFPILTSLVANECESDEFAAIIVKFNSLKTIKKFLKSRELYSKFFIKLKNLLYAQIKGCDCKLVTYEDIFVINFNKELSFATSVHKAIRLALKIINSFVGLNLKIMEEAGSPLNITLTIVKKQAEELLILPTYQTNVKTLNTKNDLKKYLKGLQVILDQYSRDEISKEYKTDSLYTIEENGKNIIFYEVILDSYILPPEKKEFDEQEQIEFKKYKLAKKRDEEETNLRSFKIFDINAKCSFKRTTAINFIKDLSDINLEKEGKIISIKTSPELAISTDKLIKFYKNSDYNVLQVNCSEELNFKPWGFFDTIFKEVYNLPFHKNFINASEINPNIYTTFKPIFEFINNKPLKAMTSEDARYAYFEQWNKLLSILNKTLILVDGFENIDDTSLQVLELYFDKYKNIKPNFIFITNEKNPVHSKIKGLLRTNLYTEFSMEKSSMDSCLETLKSDATDFIQSFYFEKIKENFKGSFLYFQNALEYLKESGIVIDFENKLLIKNKKSIILPNSLKEIYKERLKRLSKNQDASFILAYTLLLGSRLDFATLSALGVNEIETNLKTLSETNLICVENKIINVNNFNILKQALDISLKKEAETYLVKNIIAKIGNGLDDTTMGLLLGRLGLFKDEYLTLWKNAQFAIKTGDYDAYLKNCLGFLSLLEHIEINLPIEELENNKKDVYNNILMYLYNYSPAKIYFIENILLIDAINEQDDEKIVKLSNLMLQGALISSNYTDALGLLHNILSRMQNPTLKVDNNVNSKFLLLSLINIEILYNIGNFKQCVEVANDILSILSFENVEQVKPINFSLNLFKSHLNETFVLVAFAKLFMLDEDLDDFFEKVKNILGTDLTEKEAIIAIRDFLADKTFNIETVEEYSPMSKVIFLILQEFSTLDVDCKKFAQNIYQGKVLASEIHQNELDLFCDLLIAFAYHKANVPKKAEMIYLDVLENAEKTAKFNILIIAKFLLAKLKLSLKLIDESLLLVNDSLALIRKYDNAAKIHFALLENLYIEIVKANSIQSIDIDIEEQKIIELKEKLKKLIS